MSTPATLRGIPLTGLRLGAPLGTGSGGVAWAATTETGEQVAVRVLPDVGASAHSARERRLALLRSIQHPGLATVRTMPDAVDDRLVVTDMVPGPTLATVRSSRMGLPAAEVLTLAHQLASALAELHRHGIVHGDVAPTNVVISESQSDGAAQPVLVDLLADLAGESGTAGFAAPEVRAGAAPGPAADVWSLAALCLWCTRVGEREQVTRALGTATAQDPRTRPSAAALATYLFERANTPVQVPPPSVLAGAALREQAQRTPTVLRPTRRRRARHRRATPVRRVAALVLVATAAVVAGSLAWPEPPGAATPQVSTAADPTADLRPLVETLVHARDDALVAADASALAAVTVVGSPARAEDLALLESLGATRLSDLRTSVGRVEVLESSAEAVQVQTVLTQGAYERTVAGSTEQVPAQQPRCVVLALRLDGPQWAVERVSECE